jgi:hypothetical protein
MVFVPTVLMNVKTMFVHSSYLAIIMSPIFLNKSNKFVNLGGNSLENVENIRILINT